MILHFFKKIILPILFLTIPILFYAIDFEGKDFILRVILETQIQDNAEKVLEVLGYIIYIIFFFFFLYLIRKYTKKRSFTDATANFYANYPFFVYWIAAKVLGYGSVNLIMIPVYLQFKLVLRKTFDNIIADATLDEVDNEKISVTRENMENNSTVLNIYLSDTYNVTIDKIPEILQNNPTIKILRKDNKNHIRIYSKMFVKKIEEIVSEYKNEYSTINIFAYTNTLHNKKIAEKCFIIGRRNKLNKLVVFQCEKETFMFLKKGYKIKI